VTDHLALEEIHPSAEFGVYSVLNYYKTLCFIPPRSNIVFHENIIIGGKNDLSINPALRYVYTGFYSIDLALLMLEKQF
jgi:hypothetical protein